MSTICRSVKPWSRSVCESASVMAAASVDTFSANAHHRHVRVVEPRRLVVASRRARADPRRTASARSVLRPCASRQCGEGMPRAAASVDQLVRAHADRRHDRADQRFEGLVRLGIDRHHLGVAVHEAVVAQVGVRTCRRRGRLASSTAGWCHDHGCLLVIRRTRSGGRAQPATAAHSARGVLRHPLRDAERQCAAGIGERLIGRLADEERADDERAATRCAAIMNAACAPAAPAATSEAPSAIAARPTPPT